MLLPTISSICWLILAGAAFASYRLKWNEIVKMALVWVAIFSGLFLLVVWFMIARGDAATVLLFLHNIYYPSLGSG